MTYIHIYIYIHITKGLERKLKAYLVHLLTIFSCTNVKVALIQFQMLKAQNGKHDRNIVNIIQIVITPPCNFYSFVQLNYKFCKRISPFIDEKSNNYLYCY